MKYKKQRIINAIDSGALSYAAIGRVLGVRRQSVHEFIKKNNAIENYLIAKIQEADELRKQNLENKAYELALAGEVNLIKFLLERKYGYKNNLDVTSNNESFGKIEIQIVNSPGSNDNGT